MHDCKYCLSDNMTDLLKEDSGRYYCRRCFGIVNIEDISDEIKSKQEDKNGRKYR